MSKWGVHRNCMPAMWYCGMGFSCCCWSSSALESSVETFVLGVPALGAVRHGLKETNVVSAGFVITWTNMV
jgi:hypothetical protein